MDYDRTDFAARLRAKQAERTSAAIPALQVVQAAGVIAERIQTTAEWDRFLSYVQGFREKADVAFRAAQARLVDPASSWDQVELAKARSAAIEAAAQVNAFDLVLGLPKFLSEAGKDAAVDIDEYERANDARTNPETA